MGRLEDEPGRAAQLRAAEAVRALAGALVGHVNDDDVLTDIAERADELTRRLKSGAPRDLREAYRTLFETGNNRNSGILERAAGGPANPTAVPVVCRAADDGLVADVVIPAVFAGWPGMAHGGVVAGILDDVLGQLATAVGGFAATARLEIEFRRPTPVERTLRVEARVAKRRGRQIFLEGSVLEGATELVVATGCWFTIDGPGLLP
jgi:acyl-coenzyme A thioesterase PaaI-like protein